MIYLSVPIYQANFGILSLASEKGWIIKIIPHESLTTPPSPLSPVKKILPAKFPVPHH